MGPNPPWEGNAGTTNSEFGNGEGQEDLGVKAGQMRYKADMTAGALKVPESRVVADLLLRGTGDASWRRTIYGDNVLQTRSPKTAKRLATLLRGRLALVGPPLWRLIRDGTAREAAHSCLAAAIKKSKLLGDFLDIPLREQYRAFHMNLPHSIWNDFIEECRGRDPEMPRWSESTVLRLRSSVFTILAEAGYIDNTKNRRLQRVHIVKPVIRYLEEHDEQYVLRCIQVGL